MSIVHQVHAKGAGVVSAKAHPQIIRITLLSERNNIVGLANLPLAEARSFSVRLATAIAKATAQGLRS